MERVQRQRSADRVALLGTRSGEYGVRAQASMASDSAGYAALVVRAGLSEVCDWHVARVALGNTPLDE